MIGKKLGNRYEIIEKLGSGGMSIVYKGLDTVLNRLVTIKVLREQYASDEDFVRRFRREAQSVASLSHINIVSIYDVGFEEDLHYLVMEFVEGQNLKEYIRKKGKIPVNEAIPIAMQILDALQHAHENGVVHRDIKPHNILISKDGKVRVTDFGIARAASEATVTYTGTIVGSVHYISPEQAKGSSINAQSDIYAAGVVLFEMLTGELPFSGDSPIAVALQHIQNEPVSPSEIIKEVPSELSYIVLRAMQKDQKLRYVSAREMRWDLEKIHLGKAEDIMMYQDGPNDSEDTMIMPALGNEGSSQVRRRKLKPKSKLVFYITGFLLFLLVVWAGYAGMKKFFDVGETTVPNVEGMSVDQAKQELHNAGLDNVAVDYKFNNTVEQGLVITQSVPSGDKVKVNKQITLLVSKGPQMTTVPDVRGKPKRDADVALSNSGLKPSFSEEFSSDIPKGMVISQQPQPYTEVPEDSVVSVVISLGAEPKYITVPDLIRKSLDEAEKLLREYGLDYKFIKQDSTDFFEGQVISQEPARGSKINEGGTVNFVVSRGPGPTAQTYTVTYNIPNDGDVHKFQIIVRDDTGTHKEYDSVQQSGDIVIQDVTFYGTAKIDIYLDGNSVDSLKVP